MRGFHHFELSRRTLLVAMTVSLIACTGLPVLAQSDPLPSWNDTNTKQAIVEFVTDTTKEGSATSSARRADRDVRPRRNAVGRASDVQPGHLLPGSGSCRGRRKA